MNQLATIKVIYAYILGIKSENIALGKPTQQSSTVDDCKWAEDDPLKRDHCGYKNSTLAVDGQTSSDYWSGTCIHTQMNQRQAWWSVELGERHQISDVKIFFPDSSKSRNVYNLLRLTYC